MSEYYKESILFKFWEFYKESKKNIWQVSDQWSLKCNQKKKSFKTYPLNTWNFCFIQAFTATEGLNLKNKMEENVYVQNKQNVHSVRPKPKLESLFFFFSFSFFWLN